MKWIAKLLSKDDSGVSFGHVACCFIILYVAVMTTIAFFMAKQFPTTIADFPSGWVYVVGLLWGSQKASETFSKRGDPDGHQ